MEGIWRKSSRCDGGTCLEARQVGEDVQLRDAAAVELTVAAQAWVEFVEAVKDGEFDRP